MIFYRTMAIESAARQVNPKFSPFFFSLFYFSSASPASFAILHS